MGVVAGSNSSYSGTASSSPNVHAHTAHSGSSNTYLIAFVICEKAATDGTQSATLSYGGTGMTLLGSGVESLPDTENYLEDMYMFVLDSPSSGSNNFSLTLTNDGQDYAILTICLDNVDATPYGTIDELFVDDTATITDSYTVTDSAAMIVTGTYHTAADSGPASPANGTEQIDMTVASGTLGFAGTLNTYEPGATGAATVGSTYTSNAGTNPCGGIISLEFFFTGNAPTITDVNTTESWTDGDTGLVITGTNFV